MRPYASSSAHPAFLYDNHHRATFYRYRRDHRIPRNQGWRREQRASARAEERQIIREAYWEHLAWMEAEEAEQTASLLRDLGWVGIEILEAKEPPIHKDHRRSAALFACDLCEEVDYWD